MNPNKYILLALGFYLTSSFVWIILFYIRIRSQKKILVSMQKLINQQAKCIDENKKIMAQQDITIIQLSDYLNSRHNAQTF